MDTAVLLSPGAPVMHVGLLVSLGCLRKHQRLLSGKACRIKPQRPVSGFCTLKSLDLVVRHSFISCPLLLTFLPCFPCDWQPFKTQSNRIVSDGGRKHCHRLGISLLKQLQVINSFKGEKMLIFVFCFAYYSPFINRFLDSLTHFPAIIVLWKI